MWVQCDCIAGNSVYLFGSTQNLSSLVPSMEVVQQKELEKMKLEEEVAGLKRCVEGEGRRRCLVSRGVWR